MNLDHVIAQAQNAVVHAPACLLMTLYIFCFLVAFILILFAMIFLLHDLAESIRRWRRRRS